MTTPALNPGAVPGSPARVAVRLSEWTRLGPGREGQEGRLAGLSLGDDPHTRALAEALSRSGVVTITELRGGLAVETGSHVGRVVVGPLDLTILPKVAWVRWRTLFGFALRLRGLSRSDEAATPVGASSLHDLLVLELVAEVRDLLGRGLHREYVRHRADLATPRGRLDFARMAVRGGLRDATIPCRFTRRSDDSPLNRALLAGLDAAARLASDRALRGDARRLAHELEPTVARVRLDAECLAAARTALDRRTARYAPALGLIALLLEGRAPVLDAEAPDTGGVQIPGFALDMNRLWQRLLGRVLTEWTDDVEVREEVALSGVIARDPAFAPRRRPLPTPRPDFAVLKQDQLVAYLDAKYRDLWATSLPREMLYQLALYATAQGAGAAAMLYPTEDPDAAEERLVVRDPAGGGTRAIVALRPVALERLEALVAAPPSVARDRARSALVHTLAGVGAPDGHVR